MTNPWSTGNIAKKFFPNSGNSSNSSNPSIKSETLDIPSEGPFLAVLDFEATCWENSNEHEIIEFPTIIVDIKNQEIVDRFECFVKPSYDPKLSEFCKNLTGITQEQVDGGVSLSEALKMHQKFMSKYHNSVFVTCGDWDLKTMLPKDAWNNHLNVPNMYSKWINVKRVFSDVFKCDRAPAMPGMLSKLGLKLEGRHHRGIDDCVNIARISIALMKKGARFL